jgi:hypothetical protein
LFYCAHREATSVHAIPRQDRIYENLRDKIDQSKSGGCGHSYTWYRSKECSILCSQGWFTAMRDLVAR